MGDNRSSRKIKRTVKRRSRGGTPRSGKERPRFPNLEESSELSIVDQVDLDQINLDFMETLGAQLFGTLFPHGLELNHHSDEWPDLVMTFKDNNLVVDLRNIPSSFKLPSATSPEETHELMRTMRITMKLEGQTVIEFGRGVHGVCFDKAAATRVMVKNMFGRFLPGLKDK